MPTELAPGVLAVDLCTYLPASKTIIIADLHLGYEEYLRKQGTFVPRTQYKQTIARLGWILRQVEVTRVILNGDIKHEFGTINAQEWREILRLIDFFLEKNIELIIVRGNHDPIMAPIARKRDIREVKEVREDGILIAHGDYIPDTLAPIMIIGHEHPAITLREQSKTERFKCFIKGKYKRSTLIVQPCFNPLTQGTDVLQEQTLTPLLDHVQNFDAFLVDDTTHDVLPFGAIKNINKN